MSGRHLISRTGWLAAVVFCLAIRVQAQDDTNEIPQIRPPHAELPPTFWELHGTVILVAALVFLALAGLVVWRLTRPRPPVVIPPEVQAREALAALPATIFEGERLSQVSRIVRHYIQQAFELPRAELNTTEFCRVVAEHADIGPELAGTLAAFMRESDRRKFSPEPAPADKVNAVTQALALIEQAEARRDYLRAQTAAATPKPTA